MTVAPHCRNPSCGQHAFRTAVVIKCINDNIALSESACPQRLRKPLDPGGMQREIQRAGSHKNPLYIFGFLPLEVHRRVGILSAARPGSFLLMIGSRIRLLMVRMSPGFTRALSIISLTAAERVYKPGRRRFASFLSR